MAIYVLPNKLFIKLLLGFWLCSSLIILAVGALPLLQQNRDAGPVPPPIVDLLQENIRRYQDNPERFLRMLRQLAQPAPQASPELGPHNLDQQATDGEEGFRRRGEDGQPFHMYVFDAQGQLLNMPRIPPSVRQNLLMIAANDATEPRGYSFREEMFFGPFPFELQGQQYRMYGGLPGPHRAPWFFFFIDNKLLTLSLAVLLSGILCALLAWHLGKPLRSLKQSATALTMGDLGSRVDQGTCHRHDELGELGIAFNTMADAIERMVNSQQRLISDISHELRTPLTRLQLALALARKRGVAGEETDRIAYEADQLEKMIAELLELSRVKLKAQENKVVVGLAESLSQVLDDAEFEAAQKQRNLRINIDEEIALPIYPRPLSRAIENLLRNAIRYCHQEVTIQATQAKDDVVIVIADDGPGIDDSELEAIFKPFYRPQSARERESGGWGLGLAITDAAVRAHSGQIAARNRPEGGLEVTLRLPRQ